jgi:rhodanese-related sulfurtransferase
MEFYKQGKLILANAHERARFAHGHIVGSVNLPADEVQSSNIKLPTNMIIAFYCA